MNIIKMGEFGIVNVPQEANTVEHVRLFILTGKTGLFYRNSEGRPGDCIRDGRKFYEIQKDGAFKRIDK